MRQKLERGGRPTWWEVVKTVVPWVSLVVSALILIQGHLASVRRDQRTLMASATAQFLGEQPAIGAFLLLDLVEIGDEPLLILAEGIDVRAAEASPLQHARNLAALDALSGAEADSVRLRLCGHRKQGGEVLKDQLDRLEKVSDVKVEGPLQETISETTVRYLCRLDGLLEKDECRARDVLFEDWRPHARDKDWLLRWSDCIGSAPAPAPAPASGPGGLG